MHRSFVLAVIVSLILINSLPYAFAQSNFDEHRLTIAQQNAGDASANDRAFWDSIKDSKKPDELKAYLEQFPTGIFAPLARARLKVLEPLSSQSQSGKAAVPSATGPKEIRRDGRFIAYNDETVLDTRTNLMWAAKDNGSDINRDNAQSYCENYRGGGYIDWRMPTQNELADLYEAGKTYKLDDGYDVHLTETIRLSRGFVLASEIRGSDVAHFLFVNGRRGWSRWKWDLERRALPVRSGK